MGRAAGVARALAAVPDLALARPYVVRGRLLVVLARAHQPAGRRRAPVRVRRRAVVRPRDRTRDPVPERARLKNRDPVLRRDLRRVPALALVRAKQSPSHEAQLIRFHVREAGTAQLFPHLISNRFLSSFQVRGLWSNFVWKLKYLGFIFVLTLLSLVVCRSRDRSGSPRANGD